MASVTITASRATFAGKIGTTQFANGSATVDDTTAAGKAAIEFAKRHGWAYTGTAAVSRPVGDRNVYEWDDAELTAYLVAAHVDFPTDATLDDKRRAVLDAFETKAQGGSAANLSAGHTQGTMPPEGAPPVPGDNEEKASQWTTPLTGDVIDDVQPGFTTTPTAQSKVAGTTATFTAVASGTPTPSLQWQRNAKGNSSYVDIDGATAASYTTPALTVADNNGDRYRIVATNSAGSESTTGVVLTVTAS